MSTIKIGIIGYGYWGTNLVRNFFTVKDGALTHVADGRPARLEALARIFPTIKGVPDASEIISSPDVDAVVVVSAPEHLQRARVLERGVSAEKLDALLARQMPDVEKRAKAHFIVDSGQGFEHARAQVKSILAEVARMRPKQG